MMAEAPEEAAEIARLADAEVLNLGTPTRAKYEACLAAGGEAARLKKPIVLDPVGVGASHWRLEGAGRLLAAFRPGIRRVNLSEARSLLGLAGREKGVDSAAEAAGAERAALAAESRAPAAAPCCSRARRTSSPTGRAPQPSRAAAR